MQAAIQFPNVPAAKAGPPFSLKFLIDMQRDPLTVMAREQQRYGDVVRVRMLLASGYLVTDPSLIEQVLVRDHHSFIKDPLTRELHRVMGHGLLTAEREHWKRERKLASPPFTKRAIASYANDMVEISRKHVPAIAVNEARDVHRDLMELTLEIVTRTMFGTDLPKGAEGIGAALDVTMDHFQYHVRTFRRLIPSWVPIEANRKLKKAVRYIDATLGEIIAKRRATTNDDANDLVSLLLRARDDEGSGITDTALRDEAVTIFLAGHETVALALSYALLLLAQHPDILARAHAEIDRALGDRPATLADMPKLPLLESVITESMRLYPPAWIVAREATEPYTLAGHTIRKGDSVWIPQWVVHRDKRWFDNPDAFDPDRWSGDLRDRIPRFAYFPFGGGPRICIGNHFAQMETLLVLASILQQRTFELAPDSKLELDCSVTLRPRNGIRLIPRARGFVS